MFRTFHFKPRAYAVFAKCLIPAEVGTRVGNTNTRTCNPSTEYSVYTVNVIRTPYSVLEALHSIYIIRTFSTAGGIIEYNSNPYDVTIDERSVLHNAYRRHAVTGVAWRKGSTEIYMPALVLAICRKLVYVLLCKNGQCENRPVSKTTDRLLFPDGYLSYGMITRGAPRGKLQIERVANQGSEHIGSHRCDHCRLRRMLRGESIFRGPNSVQG